MASVVLWLVACTLRVQVETLVRKNLSLMWHKKFFSCLIVVMPAIFVFLLWLLQSTLSTKSNLPVPLTLQRCTR